MKVLSVEERVFLNKRFYKNYTKIFFIYTITTNITIDDIRTYFEENSNSLIWKAARAWN
ncbi:hypothetical protein ACFW04_006547 [Cataglyphis niger]